MHTMLGMIVLMIVLELIMCLTPALVSRSSPLPCQEHPTTPSPTQAWDISNPTHLCISTTYQAQTCYQAKLQAGPCCVGPLQLKPSSCIHGDVLGTDQVGGSQCGHALPVSFGQEDSRGGGR